LPYEVDPEECALRRIENTSPPGAYQDLAAGKQIDENTQLRGVVHNRRRGAFLLRAWLNWPEFSLDFSSRVFAFVNVFAPGRVRRCLHLATSAVVFWPAWAARGSSQSQSL